jgi:hypothetical protein
MAGPSIAVRILGDLTGFGKSIDDTAAKGESAAGRLHGAFTGVLGALNQSGVLGPFGEALNGIDEAIGRISDHSKGIGQAMMGVGGALAGVGVGLSAVGSKDQAAHAQLQAAVQATGKDYDDYADQVDKAIGKQEKYGDSANQTQDALRILTQATGDPAKALQYLGEASDLAAAKHESLDTAATQLSKAYNGNQKILKEFGVTQGTVTDAHGKLRKGTLDSATAMEELGSKISGQADAQANTFSGHLDAMKARFEDLAANLGAKYGPAITAVGSAMAGVGAVFQAAPAIMGVLSAAWDALTGAEYASMLPYVLIIAGLAAIGVAVYELVTHWSEVWGAIQAAVAAVWQWIVDHWPLLLDVLLGPIGIAVGLIIGHWNEIQNAVAAVWQWIVDHWPLLLAVLLGPVALAAQQLAAHWDTIKSDAAAVWQFIVDGWNGLVDTLKGIPGQVAGIFAGMWDGIWGSFRSVVNRVIDAWNSLSFTLPSIDVGPVHVGGETVGVPKLPHLAQGGLITQTGLVYAHAGEAITPMPNNTFGPAVQIENATFTSEVDVDLLLRRAAWAVQTRAA